MTLRRTPLKPGGPLVRRTPLRSLVALVSRSRLKTKSAPKRETPRPAVPEDVRSAVRLRSHGLCEIRRLAGCQQWGRQVHHRIARKAGGRHGAAVQVSNRLSNLMYACLDCHEWVTAHPAAARMAGRALEEWQDPAREPVLYMGRMVYLDDDGGVHDFDEAGA